MLIVRKWMNCIEDIGYLLRVKWMRIILMLILMLFFQVIIDWCFGMGMGCIDKYIGILVVVFLVVGMIVFML